MRSFHTAYQAGLLLLAITVPTRADEAEDLKAARPLFLAGNYAEAAELYQRHVEKGPPAAALGLARCQESTGKSAEARKTLTAAIKQHEKAAPLYAELARLYFEIGQLDQAKTQLQAALKLDEENVLARWIEAQITRDTGNVKLAEAQLKWFIDFYNRREQADKPLKNPDDLRWIGLAAGEYARWKRDSGQFRFLVNDLPAQQLEVEPKYWPARYESGRLFLEKYNEADATRDFKAALALNPAAAEVYAALGLQAASRFDLDSASTMAQRALELNPELLDAHLLKSELLMANFKVAEAAEYLTKHAVPLNPISEETLGRLAACYVVLDGLSPEDEKGNTRFGRIAQAVHERNEHCGQFYYAMAQALDNRRRFTEAVRFYEEATRRMPQLIGPRGSLAMLHMRLGEEAEGKKLLAESFDIDPFNVRTNNMLKVVEVLEGYQTMRTENFIIKYNEKYDRILARYAAKYLESQYPALCEQFGYKVPQPSLFEIFSKSKNTKGHGWFSARLIGLPYLGTVGACAGKMVGIASPNESPYNWARVLKHEFIHVINLQQTNYNLPHWFAEGIATHNEGYPRPQSWNELLVQRHQDGELFTLDNINFGFIRPKDGNDWQMAYCQAELYVQYMFSRFGDDAVAKALAAFSGNRDAPEAIKQAFGVDQAEFEKGYVEYIDKLVSELSARRSPDSRSFAELERAHEEKPDDADITAQLAYAFLSRKNLPQARKLAKEAFEQQPKHQLAAYVIARTYLAIGENDLALRLLVECLDEEKPQENLLGLLAAIREKQQKYDEALRLLALGAKFDPENDRWIKGQARVALQAKDAQKSVEMLAKLAELDADSFVVRKKLTELAIQSKQYAAAEKWGNEALQVNVMDVDTHLWLGQALLELNKSAPAVEEFSTAVELQPEHAPAHFQLAQALIKNQQPEQARKSLQQVLQLDPTHEEARKLLESLKP